MSTGKHIVCPTCATTNRVGADKDLKAAKCGSCGEHLFTAHPADIDGAAMQKHIAKSDVPVLIDVWAPWCGPCRMMGPEFEKAAGQLEPNVRFVKLNSDNEQALSQSLGIRGIPTMLLMHKGRELGRVSGAMPAAQIVSWVNDHMATVRG